ncbi:Protein ZBED8-like [Oopsacas minuta]|uniref:Protein ZBED8-like n=1 Tax=Oopsacas minuta TaxID=111878 RepID=A0AAV7JV66_9METZ|nr:Protein ZBED8-like [Oopsacas minuta]
MGSEYEVLLYHTEVRWLSRGQILKRLMALRTEVMFFLKEMESPHSEHFNSVEFIHGLAYVADIFGQMNEVNLSIQRPEVYIMDATERLQALWASWAYGRGDSR